MEFFQWNGNKQMVFQFMKTWQTISSKLPADLTSFDMWKKLERLLHNEMFDFFYSKSPYFHESVRR